ncbi:MAG: translocation/assembly module TamB domain-containing protein [Nitrospirae bacterium YQR-1]
MEKFGIILKSYKRLVLFLLVFFTLVFITHLIGSKYLKDELISELKKNLGPNVVVKDVYVKVFPPHIGIAELTIKDENGKTVAAVADAVFHIRLIPLFGKKVVIQRAFIDNPSVDMDSEYLKALIERLKKDKKKKSAVTVEIVSFLIKNTKIKLSANNRTVELSLKESKGQISKLTEVNLKGISIDYSGFKEVLTSVPFIQSITISGKPRDGGFELKQFKLKNHGVEVLLSGHIDSNNNAHVKTDTSLKMDYVKTLFGLKRPGDGYLKLKGGVDYIDKAVSVDIDVDGHMWIDTFLELIHEKEPIKGEAVFRGNIKGQLKALKATGSAAMNNGGQFYGIDVDNLTSAIVYENSKLKFYDVRGNLYHGTTTRAEVVLNMPVVNYFTLDVEAENIDSGPIFKLINWDPGLSHGKMTGKIHHEGKYFSPVATFKYVRAAQGTDNTTSSKTLDSKNVIKRVDEVTGGVTLVDGEVTLKNVEFKTMLSKGRATGTYNINNDTLNLTTMISTKDAADFTRPYNEDLRGAGTFNGIVSGKGKDPSIAGTIALSSGSVFGLNFNTMNTKADYNMRKLVLTDGISQAYGGKCRFGGTTVFKDPRYIFDFNNPHMNMDFALNDIEIDKLTKKYLEIDKLNGSLSGEFDVKGQPGNLTYTGDAAVSNLTYKGIAAGVAKSKFTHHTDKIVLKKFSIAKGSSELLLDGSITQKGKNWMDKAGFRYDIVSAKCRLNARDIPFTEKLGDASSECSIKMAGTVSNPDLSFDATVRSAEYPAVNGKISVVTKAGEAVLKGSFLDNKLLFNGAVKLTAGYLWSLNAQFKRGNYEGIIKKLVKTKLPADLKIILAGSASLKGSSKDIAGRVVLPELNLSVYRYSVLNNGNIDISLNDRKLSINSLRLNAGDSEFNVQGGIEAGKSYNLSITGQPELNLLRGESAKISWINGKTNITLSVTGDWTRPQIAGGLSVSKGSLGIKGFRYFLSDIESDIHFESNKLVIKNISTKIGGGSVTAAGVGYLDGFKLKKFYLDGVAKNVPANVGEGFTMKFGGRFLYSGDLNKQTLSGDLDISTARYSKNLYWQDLVFEKTSDSQQINPFLKNLDFNVNVKGDKNIVVDNNVAESNIKLDLQVKGNTAKPVIYGRMTAEQGKVFFRNYEFTLQSANADFAGSTDINPYINIVAETIVKGYNIKLLMNGQLKRFDLSMSSTPPLKETAILALFAGSDLSRGATSVLAGKYQGVFEERVKNITGLNRLEVVPSVSEDKTSVSPQVTVSKKLFNDKLNVTLTSGVTKGEIIKVEYKLKKNVSLVGERNELGNVGGDVKFRFEFK